MAQINFKDVTLGFGNNTIVEDFNLRIAEGEIVSFFGPSGCGKSSIMKAVLGINKPVNGVVSIGDQEASMYSYPISYVPQENDLLPWLSVLENVKLWPLNSKVSSLNPTEALNLVELDSHQYKLPHELSGGMARRTSLARGLATESKIICFDEAMVGIEKTLRESILFKLRNFIKNKGATAIFISHDYEEAILLSDRIIVFSPPPTVILKIIDVNSICKVEDRMNLFNGSEVFKEIYQELLL